MIAECDLNPALQPVYFAELIRLREFAAFAGRYKRRLPLNVQQAFERSIPPRASIADLVEAGHEELVEHELHDFTPKPRA